MPTQCRRELEVAGHDPRRRLELRADLEQYRTRITAASDAFLCRLRSAVRARAKGGVKRCRARNHIDEPIMHLLCRSIHSLKMT